MQNKLWLLSFSDERIYFWNFVVFFELCIKYFTQQNMYFCILFETYVVSNLEAMLTVSPNRQYLGLVLPTTPPTTGPAIQYGFGRAKWKEFVEKYKEIKKSIILLSRKTQLLSINRIGIISERILNYIIKQIYIYITNGKTNCRTLFVRLFSVTNVTVFMFWFLFIYFLCVLFLLKSISITNPYVFRISIWVEW